MFVVKGANRMTADKRKEYIEQVRLIISILPILAEQSVFAIKGGTAINLFYQEFPRYSVDIDLTYLPVQDRETSLQQISENLNSLGNEIKQRRPEYSVRRLSGGGKLATRILVSYMDTDVKIEVSPVMRNTLFPPSLMNVRDTVKHEYGSASMLVLSAEEVFAGKFCATLERSLPRDLFDVKIFFDNQHVSDLLLRVTIIYLLCGRRPIHEMLLPNKKYIDNLYNAEFKQIMITKVSLDDLYLARAQLFKALHEKLDDRVMTFLEGFHECNPNYSLIGLPQAENLPAIKWRLLNLNKLMLQQPEKHRKLVADTMSLREVSF